MSRAADITDPAVTACSLLALTVGLAHIAVGAAAAAVAGIDEALDVSARACAAISIPCTGQSVYGAAVGSMEVRKTKAGCAAIAKVCLHAVVCVAGWQQLPAAVHMPMCARFSLTSSPRSGGLISGVAKAPAKSARQARRMAGVRAMAGGQDERRGVEAAGQRGRGGCGSAPSGS